LADRTGLPLIHLDRVFWQPGWVETPREAWRSKVAALAAQERWIMDGNFDSSLDLRLPRADTLIWFDYPAWRCLWRALKRVGASYGRVRPDMGDGCPERIDFDFLRYIARFNQIQRPRIAAQIAHHGTHLTPIIIRRDAHARACLDRLAPVSTATPLLN
jgi:adenylate kinase family enzyme